MIFARKTLKYNILEAENPPPRIFGGGISLVFPAKIAINS